MLVILEFLSYNFKSKMRYSYIIVGLILCMCNACKEEVSMAIDSFDVVERIVDYDSIYSDKNAPLGAVTCIRLVDDILITKHFNDDYNFSFIDINGGGMLCRWGIKGEAPNEFIDFGSDFTVVGSQLVFFNRMKKEINYILISDILENKDILDVRKEHYPYTVDFRPVKLGIVKDKKILLGAFKEGRFGVLDSTNAIAGCFSEYPFDCGEVTGINRGSVFQGKIETNSKQDKFVISTFSSDVFEIYQVSDSDIYRAYVNHFNNAPQACKKGGRYTVDLDKSIVGLMNMAVSDDFICFTYSSLYENEAGDLDKTSSEILCFNWEGKKVKKYLLPFGINNFCIDKKYIYGVKYDDDETSFYRFKL